MLALLALAGGRPVMVREIVESLWGSRPPRTAANVVQTYVKRLRRVLEPHRPLRTPSEVLPRIHDGYALAGGPDTVDVWRYRQLVGQARDARQSSDHHRVLRLLSDALALWKAPPGGDLPGVSHDHLLPVAEEHSTVVGWYAEAALACSAAAEALPVVAQAAAARPFDEPLHAHLVRIYHALGRRGDAVRAYQDSRQRLQDDLGFDPGPDLCAAYQELLRGQRP